MRSTMLLGILVTALLSVRVAAQTPTKVTCPTGLTAGGPAGTYTVVLSGPTEGLVTATPDSSNSAVVTVPASFPISAGASTFTFLVTPVAAGNADVGVTVNGVRLDCGLTVAAAVAPSVAVGGSTLSTTGRVLMVGLLAMAGFFMSRRL
jgi:hypothetical protein